MGLSIIAEGAKTAARQRLGFTRDFGQPRTVWSQLCKGGTRGYDAAWKQVELNGDCNVRVVWLSTNRLFRYMIRKWIADNVIEGILVSR